MFCYIQGRKGGDSMATKKDLVIVVLITFCLTATLFLTRTTRSQVAGQYDPSLDINHDGTINMKDIGAEAKAFGTSGDPTLNVTVTNLHDYDIQTGTINITSNDYVIDTSSISCGGRSRLSILLYARNVSIGLNNNITIYLYYISWLAGGVSHTGSVEWMSTNTFNVTVYSTSTGTIQYSKSYVTYMTETKAPYCFLAFRYMNPMGANIPANWWVTFDYAVYLRNE